MRGAIGNPVNALINIPGKMFQSLGVADGGGGGDGAASADQTRSSESTPTC